MEKRWLISVDNDHWDFVIEELKKLKIDVLETLEAIHVIIISSQVFSMSKLKRIKGVIDIEEEREIGI